MNRRRRDDLPEVNSLFEIPVFGSEAEEAEFWDTHALGPGLLSKMKRATSLVKSIGPAPLGLLGFVPAETLATRSEQLETEIGMVEELADAAEARVLRWMRGYHERAPDWLLRQLDDLETELDRLTLEQQAVARELGQRAGQSTD
ncbi:MAG TPA: hypothetical protein VK821_11045 [Dehalococcoidia bacterium]|nr:hypothetical protein [Dehalococcoidia bacterium]